MATRRPVDGADAGDHAVGGQVAALVGQGRVHRVGEHAVLHEAARVEEQVEALAHGQLAGAPLAGDEIGAAHRLGAGAPGLEVVEQRLPVVEVWLIGHGSPRR